jgi:hypothetical protein
LETYLTAEIVKALQDGDGAKVVAYIAIFVFLWVEVRGLKKEVSSLNKTISDAFSEGEKRFDHIEENQLKFDHRLSVMEKHN